MSVASRRLVLQGALFGAACACLAARAAYAADAPSPTGKWVCPPCGCAADGKEFDKAGACPECGMPLVPKTADAPKPPNRRASLVTSEDQPGSELARKA